MNGIHIILLRQQHHVDVSSLDTSLLQRLFIQLHGKYTVQPTKSLLCWDKAHHLDLLSMLTMHCQQVSVSTYSSQDYKQ